MNTTPENKAPETTPTTRESDECPECWDTGLVQEGWPPRPCPACVPADVRAYMGATL